MSAAPPPAPAGRARTPWRKIGLFFLALFLFILSIQFLKSGAKALAPFVSGLAVHNAANALGFGWLLAYLVLSGSPVAATSLAFFNDGAIDRFEAFAMIAGSRLGAVKIPNSKIQILKCTRAQRNQRLRVFVPLGLAVHSAVATTISLGDPSANGAR